MRTKLHPLFIMLAVIAGAHPVPAQPTLSIATAGNQAVLFWPASAADYILQSTTNLATPIWVAANDATPVAAFTVANTSPARFFRLYLNGSASDGMALIPAGAFIMGDTLDGESDAVPVITTVSAFYMDVNLVSLGQWQSVYNWATNSGYGFDNATLGKAANYPVGCGDWYDAVKWCNARSEQAGMTPVYYADAEFTQVYKIGDVAPYANWSANGYRLPTEAEWEKAARGGLSGLRFPWGNTISESQANYSSSPTDFSYDLGPGGPNQSFAAAGYPHTTPVGYFAPNAYGLYDMAGNAFEWCWDWYGTPYAGGTDPRGPTLSGDSRVIRGGNWGYDAPQARCAWRGRVGPGYVGNGDGADVIGFRCVRGQ